MYWSRSKIDTEIRRPTQLKIATETKLSKLETVFSDDRARCFAIAVFMSRSISVGATDGDN